MEPSVLIDEIVGQIKDVDGVGAIVLGGSRARGTHTPQSDIDLCIYYDPCRPLDLDELSRVATKLDDAPRPSLLSPIGGWGPWINGGGWLVIRSLAVDFLYRDLQRVAAIIDDCRSGRVDIFYQPGHPHGFVTSIYLAEVAVCNPLFDPQEKIASLKQLARPYPPALKKALVDTFLWEARFAIDVARKSLPRADVNYVSGCCFRSICCMLQVLFAVNGQYWLNEKGAVALASSFPLSPARLQARIEQTYKYLSPDRATLENALDSLTGVLRDLEVLLESRPTV
jgi:predicted nucleotidyltransferase